MPWRDTTRSLSGATICERFRRLPSACKGFKIGGPGSFLGSRPDLGSFTRTTTAEYMGSDGVYHTAAIDTPRYDYGPTGSTPGWLIEAHTRTNLIIKNRDQANAAWTPNNCIPTAGAKRSLDGSSDGTRIVDDGTNGIHGVSIASSEVISSGGNYTAACWVSPSSKDYFQLYESKNGHYAFFDLSGPTPSVGGTGGSGFQQASAFPTPDPDWFLCMMHYSSSGASATTDLHLRAATGTTIGDEIYTGPGSTAMFTWAPMLHLGTGITPIYTDAASVSQTQDKLVVSSDAFMSINRTRMLMDIIGWMPGGGSAFNIPTEFVTPTANNIGFYFPNTLTSSSLSYDGAGGLFVSVHNQSTVRSVGDRHTCEFIRRQGALELDSIKRNGVSWPQSSTIGGNTLIHDALPDLNFFVSATTRNFAYTILSLEIE